MTAPDMSGFKQPPKDASEFGGHAGQGVDWQDYGHVDLTPEEVVRGVYQESPDPPPGVNTL
jgi:hypothetical protein